MKKTLSCIAVSLLSVLPAAAFQEQMVENAVLRAQALQQRRSDAREKERFKNYLGLAIIKMDEEMLNWNYLGPALYKSVSAVMAAKKADKTLTEDEKRAIYYAVYDLVPGAYRRNMDSKEQYDKRFRFNPENEPDNSAYSNASMLVYQAVREIGTTDSACEKWLWYLDDALVPASR